MTCDHDLIVRRRVSALAAACLALLAALATPPLPAGAGSETAGEEPAALVLRQIEALRARDYGGAYALASRELRRTFSPGEFEWMVRRAHPEVASSSSAAVVRTRESGGYVYVTVHVQGRNGRRVEALYEVVRERDGWKVNALSSRADEGTI